MEKTESTPTPLASIVIPAHNESPSLAVGLPLLLEGARPGELEIVVVANGCTDETAAVAASFGPSVTVLETSIASKSAALNLGDHAARAYPRFYVDADVEVSVDAIRRVSAVLREGTYLAASPSLRVDTSRSSAIVRSYYRFWSRLPAVEGDLAGRGVYAMTEQGRRRFGEFPDLVADDYFIRTLFARQERVSVAGCESVVRGARTLPGLVRRRNRVLAGNRQLDAHDHRTGEAAWQKAARAARVVRAHPELLIDMPAYALVTGVARLARIFRAGGAGASTGWGRDDSR